MGTAKMAIRTNHNQVLQQSEPCDLVPKHAKSMAWHSDLEPRKVKKKRLNTGDENTEKKEKKMLFFNSKGDFINERFLAVFSLVLGAIFV